MFFFFFFCKTSLAKHWILNLTSVLYNPHKKNHEKQVQQLSNCILLPLGSNWTNIKNIQFPVSFLQCAPIFISDYIHLALDNTMQSPPL